MNAHPTNEDLQGQINAIKTQLVENTTLTRQTHENTKDIVSFFRDAQGVFNFLEKLSKLVKPLMWLGGFLSVTINWTTIKTFVSSIFHLGPK